MFKSSTTFLNEDVGYEAPEANEPVQTEEGSEAPESDLGESEINLDDILSQHGDALREKLLGGYKETMKINGEERELSLEDMKRFASKGYAADEKFKSAAQMKKEAEEARALAESLSQKDVFDIIKEKGITTPQQLEDHFVELYQKMQDEANISPEARRMRELEEQLKAYEEEKTRVQREEEEARLKAEQDKYYNDLETELVSEMEKSNLPKDPFILGQVAHQLEMAENMGYDMPVSEAVKAVEERLMENILPNLLNLLSEDKKRSVIGEDFVKQLMDSKVSEAKKSQQVLKQPSRTRRPSSKPAASTEEPTSGRIDVDDFLNNM